MQSACAPIKNVMDFWTPALQTKSSTAKTQRAQRLIHHQLSEKLHSIDFSKKTTQKTINQILSDARSSHKSLFEFERDE